MTHEHMGQTPLPPGEEYDMNAVRDSAASGTLGPKRDLAEALSEPGGFHNAHMVNPAAHEGETDTGPSPAEIRAAAARVIGTDGQSR